MGTLVKPTTVSKKMPGSAGAGVNLTFAKIRNGANTAWADANFIKRRNAGNTAWLFEYSRPDVTAGGGGAATGSGAATGGTPGVGATATPGGVDSGSRSFLWTYVSGDTGIAPGNATDQNPTFTRAFTGVANGTTSAGVSAVWKVTLTDNVTGAQVTDTRTIGPLAWQNTIPAFSPHTDFERTPGSGTVNVPSGAVSLTIKVVGGGGGSGPEHQQTEAEGGQLLDGEAGGDGGVTSVTRAIAPGDWGAPIFFTVGAGVGAFPAQGGTSSTTGSVAAGSCDLTATGGFGGVDGGTGHSGSSGTKGSPNNALLGDGFGAGGAPSSQNGTDGEVQFIWS